MSSPVLNSRLDLHLLSAAIPQPEIEALCLRAKTAELGSVCLPSSRLVVAAHLLEESSTRLSCAIGWPGGAPEGDVKRFEAELAIDLGAQELDVWIHAGLLREAADERLLREFRDVVEAADDRPVKLVLGPEIQQMDLARRAASLAREAGAKCLGLTIPESNVENLIAALDPMRELLGTGLGLKIVILAGSPGLAGRLLDAGLDRVGGERALDWAATAPVARN